MNDQEKKREAAADDTRRRLEDEKDPAEREQLQNDLAEFEGASLTGDGHRRNADGGA